MRLPLFPLEHGCGKLHALAAILDPGSEKQRTQMLFHGPGADVQLLRDFLVAASFDQQLENLFIALRNFDVAQIQHGMSSLLACEPLLAVSD
jgi:hypothetical protein